MSESLVFLSELLICSFLMSDVSASLRLLTKNEQMNELLVFLANRSFAHFSQKNERFAQKTDERIPSPDSIVYLLLGLPFINLLPNRKCLKFLSLAVLLLLAPFSPPFIF